MAARAKQIMAHLDVPKGVMDRCSNDVLEWLLETAFLLAEEPGDERELIDLIDEDIEDFSRRRRWSFPRGATKPR